MSDRRRYRVTTLSLLSALFFAAAGCVSVQVEETVDPTAVVDRPELAVRWVTESAEYRALSEQIYRSAAAQLPALIADPGWSALPAHPADPGLPTAIILDVDETVLDNSPFQVLLGDKPFNRADWDAWVARADAEAVPGVVDFLAEARAAGVAVFLVTNRDCAPRETGGAACPQESDTLANLRRVGIETGPEFLMLSGERSAWTDEKKVRREAIARNYRVIMLFGDDLGDFLPCVRARVISPCDRSATAASRTRMVNEYAGYWGRGWFVLPNPMYGSWTSVR